MITMQNTDTKERRLELPTKTSIDARVQSLKLNKSDRSSGERRGGIFPWMIVLVLLGLSGWLLSRDRQLLAKIGIETANAEAASNENGSPNSTRPANSDTAASSDPNTNSSGVKEPTKQTQASSGMIALESRGYVIAKHQVLVSPQVSGRILHLNIEEGRRVTKGEVLAEIERTEYNADVEQMRGLVMRNRAELEELERGARPQEIAGATADLQEQEEVLKQLESQYQRTKEAVKTKFASMSEYEQSQSSYFSTRRRVEKLRQTLDMMKEGPRKERIEMARAALVQSEANLAKAQWRLENCTIRAPISGTILKKNAEEGNLVNPVAFNGSFSVCDIADLSDLEIDLNIQERDVSKIFQNQECEVRSEAFPNRVYKGRVARLMPIADRAKGAIPVRVQVHVPEDEVGVYLKPEMSAVVVFFGSQAH